MMITDLPLRRLLTAGVLIGLGCQAHAQSPAPVTVGELQAALAERDALIIALSNRLASLEQRLVAAGAITADAGPPPQGMPSLPASAKEPAIASIAAERALEQSLVQRGARLLPAGRFQLTPGSTYAYAEQTTADVRFRNEFQIHTLQTRLGLPIGSQLEMALPWRQVKARQTLQSAGQGGSESHTGNGIGDMRISLSKSLLRDQGWKPELVGRLNLQVGTGKDSDNDVFLGGGFDAIGIDFSASWRKDPAILFASAGYQRYQGNRGITPGDNAQLSLGLGLALSPDTSLTLSLDQSLRKELKSGGLTIDGSDQFASVFSVSSSTLLGRSALLQISAGIGLTPDAPDYQIGVSLPFAPRALW